VLASATTDFHISSLNYETALLWRNIVSKSITIPISLFAEDITSFARNLASELKSTGGSPSHLELLNMLARSGGHRNYQHLRASASARSRLALPTKVVDFTRIERLAKYFDANGLLIRWPNTFSIQDACVWVMWSRLPARLVMSERELNERLKVEHRFGDHAILRRELVERGLLKRPLDCSIYERAERQPTAEIAELIRLVTAKKKVVLQSVKH
jgi:hypothetical protein